jgi:RNA polymerase sigma-70 factor (ECF subfamily)
LTSAAQAPSDEALIARFTAGDALAFEEVLRRYERPMYNYLLRSCRDPHAAADLLQEVFLRVVERSASFEGKSKFSTWLYTIARNLCIDASRKMGFRRHRSLDAPGTADDPTPLVERSASGGPGQDRAAVSQRLRGEIARAVEALPEEQREVFLLREVQHLPFREIADIVGVPENTVKSRMRYALERLQAALCDYEDYVQELMG